MDIVIIIPIIVIIIFIILLMIIIIIIIFIIIFIFCLQTGGWHTKWRGVEVGTTSGIRSKNLLKRALTSIIIYDKMIIVEG